MGDDAVRLLARNSAAEHATLGIGYTSDPSRALRAEPEAVTADVQRALTARAGRTARERQLEEWNARRAELQRTLDWLHSQRFVRDVRSTIRALERQLARLDRRIAGS